VRQGYEWLEIAGPPIAQQKGPPIDEKKSADVKICWIALKFSRYTSFVAD